ncbi:hypothetical protein V2J09_022791 [Rumex salicifolius]
MASVVIPGSRRHIGDGRDSLFWSDHWLLDGPLLGRVVSSVPAGILDSSVADMWEEDTGWKWAEFSSFLPAECLFSIVANPVLGESGVPDCMLWQFMRDGSYSVASAYSFLHPSSGDICVDRGLYKAIWKLACQERARTFCWRVVKGAVFTNKERFRCHLAFSDLCAICKTTPESLVHLFRDCPMVKGAWELLDCPLSADLFFSLDFAPWVRLNLLFCAPNGRNWRGTFASALWVFWKHRNNVVLGDGVGAFTSAEEL